MSDELREKLARAFDGIISNIPGPDYWAADLIIATIKDDIVLKSDLTEELSEDGGYNTVTRAEVDTWEPFDLHAHGVVSRYVTAWERI